LRSTLLKQPVAVNRLTGTARGLVYAPHALVGSANSMRDATALRRRVTLGIGSWPATIYDPDLQRGFMRFSGTQSLHVTPYNPTGNITALSVSVWIRRASAVGADAEFYFSQWAHDGVDDRAWYIGTAGSTNYAVRCMITKTGVTSYGYNYVQDNTTLSDNDWHNVGFVFRPNELTLYIDGVNVGRGDNDADNGDQAYIYPNVSGPSIGATASDAAPITADIAQPLIWLRALSDAEMWRVSRASDPTLYGVLQEWQPPYMPAAEAPPTYNWSLVGSNLVRS
jgi:hypothetical protein